MSQPGLWGADEGEMLPFDAFCLWFRAVFRHSPLGSLSPLSCWEVGKMWHPKGGIEYIGHGGGGGAGAGGGGVVA